MFELTCKFVPPKWANEPIRNTVRLTSAHASRSRSQEVDALNLIHLGIRDTGMSSAGDPSMVLTQCSLCTTDVLFSVQNITSVCLTIIYCVAKSKMQSLCNRCNVNFVYFALLALLLMLIMPLWIFFYVLRKMLIGKSCCIHLTRSKLLETLHYANCCASLRYQ